MAKHGSHGRGSQASVGRHVRGGDFRQARLSRALLGTRASRPHFRSRALRPRTFGPLRAGHKRPQDAPFPGMPRSTAAVG